MVTFYDFSLFCTRKESAVAVLSYIAEEKKTYKQSNYLTTIFN